MGVRFVAALGVEVAEQVGFLQHAAWTKRLVPLEAPQEWVDVRLNPEQQGPRYAGRMVDPDYKVMGILDGEKLLGFASLKKTSAENAPYLYEMGALYVHPDHEGAGVGKTLLADTLALARAMGWTPMIVWTFAENARARKLYEGAGGKLLGRTDAPGMELDIPHVSYELA